MRKIRRSYRIMVRSTVHCVFFLFRQSRVSFLHILLIPLGIGHIRRYGHGLAGYRIPGPAGACVTLTPHQLRHAFATICFDADLSAKDAAQLLGHSKVELTMDVYTHIRQSRVQRTAEQLNAFVSS